MTTGLTFWPRLSQVHCQEPSSQPGEEEEGPGPLQHNNRGTLVKTSWDHSPNRSQTLRIHQLTTMPVCCIPT